MRTVSVQMVGSIIERLSGLMPPRFRYGSPIYCHAMTCPALQFLILTVAGWLTRQQVAVMEYLVDENRVLREQLDGRRLRLTDAQRRRLAVKGKAIGRKALGEVASIVTPDTILRWYRELARSRAGNFRRTRQFLPRRGHHCASRTRLSSHRRCEITGNLSLDSCG